MRTVKPAGTYTKMDFALNPTEALEELMDRFGSSVMRTAYFYTGDLHLAEDISQEAFLRAYRHWESFRGDSAVGTWLTTITVNLCRDKMGVRMFSEQPTDPSRMERGRTIGAEEEALVRLEKTELLRHLLELPLHYQEALYLYYYADLSTREIAEATSTPEGTVHNRLHRGREALSKAMTKEEDRYG